MQHTTPTRRYDEGQLVEILSALYPPPESAGQADEKAKSTKDAKPVIASKAQRGAKGSHGSKLAPVRAAWSAFGGGELVRLPANPFDFGHHHEEEKVTYLAEDTRVLVAQADRWQCAVGLQLDTFADVLALIAEAMGMSAGWSDSVTAPLAEAASLGQRDLTFAQFTHAICELRHALKQAAETADEASSSSAQGLFAPLLALQGPVSTTLTDESFVNPLRHLAKGKKRPTSVLGSSGGRWESCDCGLDMDALDEGVAAAEQLGQVVVDAVDAAVVNPLLSRLERVCLAFLPVYCGSASPSLACTPWPSHHGLHTMASTPWPSHG